MYFCMAYGWYFTLQYLPACLDEAHGVSKQSFWGAIAKGGPLILGAGGCWLGGWLTDAYVRRIGDRRKQQVTPVG